MPTPNVQGFYPSEEKAKTVLAVNGYSQGGGGGRRYTVWWNPTDIDPLLLFVWADGAATITRDENCE